jgi:hypothetical protein
MLREYLIGYFYMHFNCFEDPCFWGFFLEILNTHVGVHKFILKYLV